MYEVVSMASLRVTLKGRVRKYNTIGENEYMMNIHKHL